MAIGKMGVARVGLLCILTGGEGTVMDNIWLVFVLVVMIGVFVGLLWSIFRDVSNILQSMSNINRDLNRGMSGIVGVLETIKDTLERMEQAKKDSQEKE